jgi:PKD repeat protein
VGDVITFSPLVRGSKVGCEWDFGDDSTASGCDTNHIYEKAGTYRASLTASNSKYSDTSTRSIVIKENACDEIPTLKQVFFAAHSSDLTLEMRQLLRDNFSATIPCTDRIMEVNGYAFDTERNASELAEQRARTVIQYYMNLGVSSRKVDLGMVNVQRMARYGDLAWTGRKASTILVDR